MKKKDFLAQYQTKEWYELSKRIKARDKNTCQMCGRHDLPISVHHKVYYEDRRVWEYPESSLICICDRCHSEVTANSKELYTRFQEVRNAFREFGFSDNVLYGVLSHLLAIIENIEDKEIPSKDDKTLAFLVDVICSTQDYNDLKVLKHLGVRLDDFVKFLYSGLYSDYVSSK